MDTQSYTTSIGMQKRVGKLELGDIPPSPLYDTLIAIVHACVQRNLDSQYVCFEFLYTVAIRIISCKP